MTTITIKILKTNGHSAAGKLADAEIHFTGGELDGLKLVGFAIWQRRDGKGQNVRCRAEVSGNREWSLELHSHSPMKRWPPSTLLSGHGVP